nr:hypothetical protein [Lysinibacillus timonensis]
MKILLRIYLIAVQLIYLLTLQTWIEGIVLAIDVLGSAPTLDSVLWLLFLPVFTYPIMILGCSIIAWRIHVQKPISSLVINFIPMFWIITYCSLRLMLNS